MFDVAVVSKAVRDEDAVAAAWRTVRLVAAAGFVTLLW
jgi:hypothetical protein